MDKDPYTKREHDEFRADIRDALERILDQTTQHNHRMTKIERYMLILGTATAVTITLKFPELAAFIKLI